MSDQEYELDTASGAVRGVIVEGPLLGRPSDWVALRFRNRHGYEQHVATPRAALRAVEPPRG